MLRWIKAELWKTGAQLDRPRGAVPVFVCAWILYGAFLYPWFLNWGATRAEQAAALPGDELLTNACCRFTRAITIDAPPSQVWPWIVQIGQERAGFYSNTWLENLTGADIHNADAIHPAWQQRKIGDRVLLARPDLGGGIFRNMAQTRIVAMEPERMIANIPGRFVLLPVGERSTRLLVREQLPVSVPGRIVSALLWDPMHFVMQERMLRGIKERSEGQPLVAGAVEIVARVGWALAALVLLGIFLARWRWRWWGLLPAGVALPILRSTGDWQATLAGFLAVGITVLGAQAFGRKWWPPYLLLATAVALTLLLSPDAYAVFGVALGFLALVVLISIVCWHIPLYDSDSDE